MSRLTKLFVILVTIVILGGGVIFGQSQISSFVDQVVKGISKTIEPCSQPITYSLGTFDSQFGMSKEAFLTAVSEAEAIWEQPVGRELFAYDAVSGSMKVHLIYDYRQEAADKLKSLGLNLEDNSVSYETMKRQYDALKAQYASDSAAYEARLKIFNQKYKAYQELIAYWNTRGGAPEKEYKQIKADEPALQAELASLNLTAEQLNQMTTVINSLVKALNSLGSNLNLTVEKYNTVGRSLGESFEEGLYTNDNGVQKIEIFEFKNRDELVRVLAHELGHALGLDHVSDPEAIMYRLNQSTNKDLTRADLALLEARCGA